MTNIAINDEMYKQLVKVYEKEDKIEYPTFKNYIEKYLQKLLKSKKA